MKFLEVDYEQMFMVEMMFFFFFEERVYLKGRAKERSALPDKAEERRVGVGTGMLAGYNNKWGFAASKLLLSVVRCHVMLACGGRISGILNEEGGIDAHLDFLFSKFFFLSQILPSPKYFLFPTTFSSQILSIPRYFFCLKFPAGIFKSSR